MKIETLETLSDDDLRSITERCGQLLALRDKQRKDEAMEKARATLAAVGLNLNDLVRAKIKPNKGPSYKGGHTYQHPTDKTLVWRAQGQKPKWLRELEASGSAPVEIDNQALTARKAG